MKYISLVALLISATVVFAQEFGAKSIADTLRKEADIVIRKSVVEFEVLNEGEAIKRTTETKTILNKAGERKAYFAVVYDDHCKIKKINAVLFDANGRIIKKYKEKDFADGAIGAGLVTDSRLKIIDFHQSKFPYTIHLNVEEHYSGIVSYPFWQPTGTYRCGVEHAEFKIIHPANMSIQMKLLNGMPDPETTNAYDKTSLNWVVRNVKPIKSEPYSPPWKEIFPAVWTAPVNFEYEGTNGSMASWKSFGMWSWNLLQGRDELPPETVAEIDSLVDGVVDEKEKVERLYKYMQSKTRYVSIQLGIGGWQPFSALKVDETGYGDCKALSNYMRTILKVAGIDAYYTIIGNGSQKILFEDFACMGQANHAIVAVPLKDDTVWLECTSQTIPFGYIGKSNSNRRAVLITPEGGKVVKTPVYNSFVSRQSRHVKVELSEEGDAKAWVKTVYSGGQFENRRYVINQSAEDQKRWLLQNVDFSSADISKFSFSKPIINNGLPQLEETLEVNLRKFSSKTGSRIFFPIMILDNFEASPEEVKKRSTDVFKEFGYLDIDTIHFNIPELYKIEVLPASDTIRSPFGEYVLSVDVLNDTVCVHRKLHMFEGRWSAESYEKLRDFYTDIRKADNSSVVLVNKL